MNQLPLMEQGLNKVLSSLSEQEVDKESLPDLIRLYSSLMSTYNTSLDLVRKVLVYFPPDDLFKEKEILNRINSMSSTDRALVYSFINKLHDNSEARTDSAEQI